jgi:PilZ domain-containing protein
MRNMSLLIDDFRTDAAGERRRRHGRYRVDRRIDILPMDGPHNTAFCIVQLIDCSLGGLALSSAFSLECGTDFLAKLKVEHVYLVEYRVTSCQAVGDHYRIGAALIGVEGPDDTHDADPETLLKSLLRPY